MSGIDVSYIDTVSITMAGYKPVIENNEYNTGKYYSYYKLNSNWQGEIRVTDLFWIEDSIYLNYKTISGTTDTIHHVYSGARL